MDGTVGSYTNGKIKLNDTSIAAAAISNDYVMRFPWAEVTYNFYKFDWVNNNAIPVSEYTLPQKD